MASHPANKSAGPANPSGRAKVVDQAVLKTDTLGDRLRREMSEDNDTFSVRMLIDQAADIADLIEGLRRIISGNAAEWLSLKLGPQVISVAIDEPVKMRASLSRELRGLLAEIHKQRAPQPSGTPGAGDRDPASHY